MPILSVIIPVYNVEKYLRQCLDSVVNQTLEDIEVIVINDGSRDNSKMILDEYANRYDNIRVVDKINEGVAIARNIGIDMSKGKYIAFLDSDDYIDYDMYKNMITRIEVENADIIQCGFELVDQNTNRTVGYIKNEACSLNNIDATKLFLSFKIIGYTCNKVYRRKLFIDNDIKYPKVFCYEDMRVVLASFLNCNKMIIINKTYYKYRQVGTSLSKTASKKHIKTYIDQLEIWMKIIREFNNNELNQFIITFNLIAFINVLKMYILYLDCDRKLIYRKFNSYFVNIEPDIGIVRCLKNRNITKGFKFIYILWKLRVYDLFVKYKIL